MLPEEQLYKILRNKQAGIFDLYMQQGNLGGNTFKDDENPLQALLGQEFVDKYGEDYADTLNDTWFSGDKRLTSQTGARLMQDLNKMDARGIAALRGMADNPEKAISLLQEINNSRVGVGGYTQSMANKDTSDIADKLRMAARLKKAPDVGLFNAIAKKYVRGSLTGAIDSLDKSTSKAPWYAKPFIRDLGKEFADEGSIRRIKGKNVPVKLQATSPSGKIDESSYSGKTDQQESSGFAAELRKSFSNLMPMLSDSVKGSGKYMLPALLLGALGGGLNKMNGGSFLAPLLLMLLLGGAYGIGRNKGWFGSDENTVNKAIDKANDTVNNYKQKAYETGRSVITPYISKDKTSTPEPAVNEANPFITNNTKTSAFNKFANYRNAAIMDFIR